MDLMMGLINSKKGEIFIDGINIVNQKHSWNQVLGYVAQNLFFLNDTIEKNIAFGHESTEINKNKIYKVLKDVDLLDFVSDLKHKEKTIIGEGGHKISGGQRQRIAIARALYLEPEIIFFDEATSSLDDNIKNKIHNCIFNLDKNITIIFISHDPRIMNYCNKIITVKDHKLIETNKKLN
jgi:ABC-type bacteriocin/lantibiotic exporter with double-glycine peptidase domain